MGPAPLPGIAGLTLARGACLEILDAARAGFPEECCGLLIGTVLAGQAHAAHAVPAANVAADRRRHFEIDPAMLLAVQRMLREKGTWRPRERILGYFHSHPQGAARPSGADLAGARETGLVTLIAVPPGKAGPVPLHAWLRLGQGAARRFRPLRLDIGA